jgi:hypothetical protein
MKSCLFPAVILLLAFSGYAQTKYYEGEWSEVNRSIIFKGLLKLDIKNNSTEGQIIWTFIAADSSNPNSVAYYRGKKGLIGIELITGTLNLTASEMTLEGYSKDDPGNVIGLDKYYVKFSMNRSVIYGKTWSNGEHNGLVFFKSLDDKTGAEKEKLLLKIKTQQEKNRVD